MSTLRQALSKIYGQNAAEGCTAEQNCSDAPEETPASAAQDPVAVTVDAEKEAREDPSSIDTASAEDGTQEDLSASSSTELTAAVLRFDGPSSVVTAAPHFDLASIGSPESYDTSQPEIHLVEQSAVEADEMADVDDTPLDTADSGGECEDAEELVADELVAEELVAEEPAPSELATERPHKPIVALHPEWEVDRFRWPETCQRLLLEKDEVLQAAVESLCQMGTRGGAIVALVGEQPGDGVSTMALCLARCAAQSGRRVILVDADISTPSLATSLGLNTPCSWHDSIIGDAPLAESIVLSVEDQLCMMPLHFDCQQSAWSLTDKPVANLLREASASNDLIVVDCGAIERLTERANMHGAQLPCDLAVIVRDASRGKVSDDAEILQALRQLRVGNVMLAENFVHLPKPSGEERKNSAA